MGIEVNTNKLIAKFMGRDYNTEITHICSDLYSLGYRSMEIVEGIEPLIPYEYYHSSWEWLMPVVEKIESIKDEHHGHFGVYISSNSCTIQGTKLRLDKPMANPPIYFNNVVLGTKLDSTYQAVVTFIKWYNKNLK